MYLSFSDSDVPSPSEQKEEIKRNYEHLEVEIAADDLGSNDTSSWAALISAAKTKESA